MTVDISSKVSCEVGFYPKFLDPNRRLVIIVVEECARPPRREGQILCLIAAADPLAIDAHLDLVAAVNRIVADLVPPSASSRRR